MGNVENNNSFTVRAMNKYEEYKKAANIEIEDYISDGNLEGLINYLTDESDKMNFGTALRIYICENYFNNNDKKTGTGTKRGYEDIKMEEYIKLIEELREINGIENKRAQIKDIKKWLTDGQPSREVMFRLGFLFKMTDDVVSEFLTKHLDGEDYNMKAPEEVIYKFCHRYKISYKAAEELVEEYKSESSSLEELNYPQNTAIMKDNIESYIKEKDEENLMKYLKENMHKYIAPKKVMCKRKPNEEKSSIVEKRKNNPTVSNSRKDKVYEMLKDIKAIIELLINVGKIKEKPKGDIITNNFLENNVFCITSMAKDLKETVNGLYLKDILNGIPKKVRLGEIEEKIGKPTKKEFVFLYYFRFVFVYNNLEILKEKNNLLKECCQKYGEPDGIKRINDLIGKLEQTRADSEEYFKKCKDLRPKDAFPEREDDSFLAGDFMQYMDTELLNLGYGTLYIANKFENLILLSLCYRDPWKLIEQICYKISDEVEEEF